MLIEEFLPSYQIAKAHEMVVNAPVQEVYEAACSLDLSKSITIRKLFQLRGLPPSALTLSGLQKIGFIKLGQNPNYEFLLGLIGRFWTPAGDLQKIKPAAFNSFNQKGFAKAAWNFSMKSLTKDKTALTTETRIHCIDRKSYVKFRLYWLLIGPFSSWIRRESLKIIKQEAENRIEATGV